MDTRAVAPTARLMVIFSAGGLGLAVHGRSGTIRCQPSVVTLAAPLDVVLEPFPEAGSRGLVAGGRARIVRDDVDVASGAVGADLPRGRWSDLDVLSYAASTLFGWIVLPVILDGPAVERRELEPSGDLRRVEVVVLGRRHVVGVDGDGLVRRHEEGHVIHELSGHCDFEGTIVATRRRTLIRTDPAWNRRSVPVAWADVVAAHVLPVAPIGPPGPQ